ncbi:hypothetical protein SDC9_93877 [bioreactor metagenome]|uniref:NAD-specific glutamate dehydrogenase n=1 Tax=bioreactor metagenome TaxID=1076179 RepID=A0A645A1T3_9ZZZZ
MFADLGQHGFDGRRVERARAGHALQRHVVHIAGRQCGHLLHALGRAGGGQQEDQVHVLGAQLGGKVGGFLGRVVHDQHAVNAGFCRVVDERIRAVALVVALHRIGVAHQHHGRGLVLLAELAHIGQHLLQVHAIGDGAVTSLLDHRTVGHGIGEGHAQLDHVGTGLDHAVHERGRDGGERVACRDVRNEGRAAFGFQFFECCVDAAHAAGPPLTVWPRMLGRS